MRFINKLIITLLLISYSALSFAANQPSEAFDQWIMKSLHAYGIPGVSIAVIKKGNILWAKGYGYANIASQEKVANNTIFQTGAISSSLTALAALTTFEEKKYSIDKNINYYLSDWKITANKYTSEHPVTLEELLSHSAGIDIVKYQGYTKAKNIPTVIELLQGKAPATTPEVKVVSMPGVKHEPSDGGYLIVQQLLEGIYKKPFASLMRNAVLNPLQMDQSTFHQPLPSYLKKYMATPYIMSHTELPNGPRVYVASSVGGLWSTPSDIAKFVIAIQNALKKNDKANSFPSQTVAQEMLQATIDPNQSMGFTVSVDKKGQPELNGKYFMQKGSNPGYMALLIGNVESGNGAVIMINSSPPKSISKNSPQEKFINNVLVHIEKTYNWQ